MKHAMNIAMMVRSYMPAPRPSDIIYAPIDLEVEIAKGLAARGHNITVYAPLGSVINVPNVTVETLNLRPLVKNQSEFDKLLDNTEFLSHDMHGLWDRKMVIDMYDRAEKGEFDLLHFHHPESALSAAVQHQGIPTVYTLHDPIYEWYREVFELFASPNQQFISISNNQRRDAPDLPYAATVYNGTDVELFNYFDEAEDFLLFAGRVTAQKGVKEAIQVARKAKKRLLIIGPVNHGSQSYFDQYIKPELDDQILYLGRMDQDQLPKYYQKAMAVLTPVQWEEPFGLTTIEAMACGAPVISLRRGGAPEIIKHGKTGYVVDSLAEMVECVERISEINRHDCRDHVRQNFSLERMVDDYEKTFMKLLDWQTPTHSKTEHYLRQTLSRAKKTLRKRL